MLVTGGTGTIGEALVRAFCTADFQVRFLFERNQSGAEALEAETTARGLALDFLANSWWDLLPREAPSVLVNNAGINISRALTDQVSILDWERTLQVNVTAPFVLCQKYLPAMVEAGFGRIINISSIYGLCATPGNLPYTVSKHALSGLTKTISKEYAQHGVTANELCPGAVDSALVNRIAAHYATESGTTVSQEIEDVIKEIPSQRLAVPEDIANTAVFLASSGAAHINGASIVIDGGTIA